MNAIELREVSKSWGRTKVLHQVSLSIPQGSVCALLGDNGVGKTTLLKILLGIERADTGSVNLLGQSNARYFDPALRMRIGYVPERPEFPERVSVRRLAKLDAPFLSAEFPSRLEAVLSRMQVPLEAKISTFSKGTRAKLALAYALAKDPDLLVLDEPTSGLDIAVRQEVLNHLIDLSVEGRTIILTSHMIHEVERVADRVAILVAGKLVRFAEIDELKRTFFSVRCNVSSPLNDRPYFDAVVHRTIQRGRDWEFVVESQDSMERKLEQLIRSGAISSFECSTANLETIYLALSQPARGAGSGAGSQEVLQ